LRLIEKNIKRCVQVIKNLEKGYKEVSLYLMDLLVIIDCLIGLFCKNEADHKKAIFLIELILSIYFD